MRGRTLAEAERVHARLARRAARLDARCRAVATVRLVLAVLVAIAAVALLRAPAWREVATWAVAGALVAFVAAVVVHRRWTRRARLAAAVTRAAEADITRLAGRWRDLTPGAPAVGAASDLATDLSLTGPSSLQQLVSRAVTPWGKRRLADLLTRGLPAPDLALRQEAVRSWAPRGGMRRRLEAEGHLAGDVTAEAASLAQELAQPSWLAGRPWIAPLGAVLGALTVGQIVVTGAWGVPTALWAFVAVNVAVTAWLSGRLLPEYEGLLDREQAIVACAGMLSVLERSGQRAELPARWRAEALQPSRASGALRELSSILGALSLRRNAMWWPVQAMVLWDTWQVARLARWRGTHGVRVARWLDVLAEAEACASLAGHAAVFGGVQAEMSAGGPSFQAEGLAHPLLGAEAVPNDLSLDGAGRLLVLTGSNMSGKSTLLRAVGVNVALALAGGTARATGLRMRPCRLMTSIRVTDALDEGVSLFYAEVRRLRAIVQAAEDEGRDGAPPALFLVDEILRGTNTRERHAASRAVVARLARTGACGIVTSHDLELTQLADTVPGVQNGHFREEIHDGRMTFDYRLRPGPVTTTNALEILRLEGLEIPEA